MHNITKNLIHLEKDIKRKVEELKFKNYYPNIIAVSKTFPLTSIIPLIDYGHIHFGENKVQEAVLKWGSVKKKNERIKLHMIGGLQTNKVKHAVDLFDYIHSVDSIKLANKIAEEQIKQKKSLKIFLQVNIGKETQKSGTSLNEISKLSSECFKMNLNVIGLMCLPPVNEPTSKFFSLIKKKNDELNYNDLSLGMSNDYIDALKYKSTFIRVGTKIFGERT